LRIDFSAAMRARKPIRLGIQLSKSGLPLGNLCQQGFAFGHRNTSIIKAITIRPDDSSMVPPNMRARL